MSCQWPLGVGAAVKAAAVSRRRFFFRWTSTLSPALVCGIAIGIGLDFLPSIMYIDQNSCVGVAYRGGLFVFNFWRVMC